MGDISPKKTEKQNYFAVGEVFLYIKNIFKKKEGASVNVRLMHGVNRITIVMFAIAFLIWLTRRLF
jgi:hypothetical protein